MKSEERGCSGSGQPDGAHHLGDDGEGEEYWARGVMKAVAAAA